MSCQSANRPVLLEYSHCSDALPPKWLNGYVRLLTRGVFRVAVILVAPASRHLENAATVLLPGPPNLLLRRTDEPQGTSL